jgi:hypothetical protein
MLIKYLILELENIDCCVSKKKENFTLLVVIKNNLQIMNFYITIDIKLTMIMHF